MRKALSSKYEGGEEFLRGYEGVASEEVAGGGKAMSADRVYGGEKLQSAGGLSSYTIQDFESVNAPWAKKAIEILRKAPGDITPRDNGFMRAVNGLMDAEMKARGVGKDGSVVVPLTEERQAVKDFVYSKQNEERLQKMLEALTPYQRQQVMQEVEYRSTSIDRATAKVLRGKNAKEEFKGVASGNASPDGTINLANTDRTVPEAYNPETAWHEVYHISDFPLVNPNYRQVYNNRFLKKLELTDKGKKLDEFMATGEDYFKEHPYLSIPAEAQERVAKSLEFSWKNNIESYEELVEYAKGHDVPKDVRAFLDYYKPEGAKEAFDNVYGAMYDNLETVRPRKDVQKLYDAMENGLGKPMFEAVRGKDYMRGFTMSDGRFISDAELVDNFKRSQDFIKMRERAKYGNNKATSHSNVVRGEIDKVGERLALDESYYSPTQAAQELEMLGNAGSSNSSGKVYIDNIIDRTGNLGKGTANAVQGHEGGHYYTPATPAEGFDMDYLRRHFKDYFDKRNSTELAARGTQIKDFFGLKGDEEITEEMLKFAENNYIRLTKYDNLMTDFFNSIRNWKKAAKWLSKNSLANGGYLH